MIFDLTINQADGSWIETSNKIF